jgi:two-component system chemotaxis response regulator CheY
MSQLALIVEDESSLRAIYRTVLDSMGFEVIEAGDGEDALDVLDRATPTIIFLDMLLPRVDGPQVLDYIQSSPHLQHVPVVVLTAHHRFQQLIQLTANDLFLLKPVRPRDIRTAVQHVLATL